jgi:hypothetical protein
MTGYEHLAELAERELQIVREGLFEALPAIDAERRRVLAQLPAAPPPTARPALERGPRGRPRRDGPRARAPAQGPRRRPRVRPRRRRLARRRRQSHSLTRGLKPPAGAPIT